MSGRRIHAPASRRRITLTLDGQPLPALEGEPVAAALLAGGVEVFGRSVKYHRPRGPSCGTGQCSHCLMRVDGLPNVRTCQTAAREGMVLERQNVVGGAEHDLLGVTDWLFPRGLDHHEMFTGIPLLQPVVEKVVRRLSGFGRLPDAPISSGAAEVLEVDVLVVGAGSAGLAAARAARAAGAATLLVESASAVGGRAASGLWPDAPSADDAREAYLSAGGTLWLNAAAVQIDREAHPLEVAVDRVDHLVRVRPAALVLATGGYASLGLFENGDLPGVYSARWAATLLTRWGVLVGQQVLVCGDAPEAGRMAALLEGAGARVAHRLPASAAFGPDAPEAGPRLVAALGSNAVRAAVVLEGGETRELACDAIVLSLPPAPAHELAVNAGATVAFDAASGGFPVEHGLAGVTRVPDLFVCGSLTGPATPEAAAQAGLAAGRAAAEAAAVLGGASDAP